MLFALGAGLFWALMGVTAKKIMKDVEAFDHTNIFVFLILILYSPFFLYFVSKSGLSFGWEAWAMTGVSVLGNIAGIYSQNYAIKNADLSLVMPIIRVDSIFVAFTAWIILGETLSFLGFLGAAAVALGGYIVLLEPNSSLLKPIKRLATDLPVLVALIGALSFSISAVGDRFATQIINPQVYLFILYFFVTAFFTGMTLYRGRISEVKEAVSKYTGLYLLVGLFSVLALIGTLNAVSLVKAGRAIPTIRIEILLSVLFGGYFFKEEGTVRRLVGSMLIIGGIAVVMLF